MARYWRCAYCKGSATVLKVDGNGGQTTHALAHLKNKHQIDCNADNSAIPTEIASLQATAAADATAITTVASKAVREAYGLVTTFDAALFRHSLIQFIVIYSVAFSIVESLYFQALLISCLHVLTPFFVKAGKRKFTFRYGIYSTKATYENDLLPADEFQRFIYNTPTTVKRNDIYWNPISWWIDKSNKGNYDSLFLYALD
jgi:hypothetical protein